jgi:simple sugar transport system permease protein/ribose transport system permease protein
MTTNAASTSLKANISSGLNLGKVVGFVLKNIVWFLLIISIIIMGIIEPIFFSSEIMKNILVQASVLGVLTAGLSFCIMIGEIDLSIVGMMGFSAAIGTTLMNNGLNWVLAVLIIIAMGTVFGLFNGILVAKLKAVSLIETLAINFTLIGAILALTQGRSIINFPVSYKWIGQQSVFGIPVLPIVFLLIYLIVHTIWNRTSFGRSLYAVGGNRKTAHVSGINVDFVRIMAFTISGLLAGVSGFLLSSYLGAVTVTFGTEYGMYGLAASVMGGISLTGGKGKIGGVLGGVLLLTVIQVGLQMLGISSYFVQMAGGLMILVAVLFDAVRNMMDY